MKKIIMMMVLITTLFITVIFMSSCTCSTCAGVGLIDCQTCTDPDRQCICFDGYDYCDFCDGVGCSYETCSICDGKGFIRNPITWQTYSCDIIEEIDCSHCYDGKIRCSICEGDGILDVAGCVCDSDNKVPCPDCSVE